MNGLDLKMWRLERGYSQTMAAERLRTKIDTYRKWEGSKEELNPLLDFVIRFTELEDTRLLPEAYVYTVTYISTGEYYIGKRVFSCGDFGLNENYMGSGKWPKEMAKAGIKLHKKIVEVCASREAASELEYSLIKKATNDPLCMNGDKPSIIGARNSAYFAKKRT